MGELGAATEPPPALSPRIANMLAQIEETTNPAMLAVLLKAAQTWPLEQYEQVEAAFSRRDDALRAKAAPAPVIAGMNPALWEVVDTDTRKAKCLKHQVHLVRFEGVSKKGKPYVRFDCPARDVNGNERGYCATGSWHSDIFEDAK